MVAYRADPEVYREYYMTGRGGGMNFPVFSGDRFQQGYGLGNLLAGLFRSIIPTVKRILPSITKIAKPILKKGAQTLARTAIKSGKTALKHAVKQSKPVNPNKLKETLKRTAKKELTKFGKEILDELSPPPKKKAKKKKNRKSDIFD